MASLITAGNKPANTIYQKSVKAPSFNMLKPGANNAKLGGIVTAKMWQGFHMYSLTLEERATCPTDCEQWNNCYGNNMPFAHRFNHQMPGFYDGLETQLEKLSKKHGQGFVVRLHVLGDFFSPAYIEWWEYAINKFPQLHVFGYTHRDPKSTMGQMLDSLNARMPNRWAIRFSDEPVTQMSAHVVDKGYVPRKGLEIVCPEQLGQAKSCADCGLCWSARNRKIMFVEH